MLLLIHWNSLRVKSALTRFRKRVLHRMLQMIDFLNLEICKEKKPSKLLSVLLLIPNNFFNKMKDG